MSPDEILADLRDIHLPAAESSTALTGFNFWPLLVVALILCGVLTLRTRHKGAERRRLRRAIDAFAQSPSEGGMTELLALRHRASDIGVRVPALPSACFHPEGANDNAVLSDAAQALHRALGR